MVSIQPRVEACLRPEQMFRYSDTARSAAAYYQAGGENTSRLGAA
jgi:hypothetical protein